MFLIVGTLAITKADEEIATVILIVGIDSLLIYEVFSDGFFLFGIWSLLLDSALISAFSSFYIIIYMPIFIFITVIQSPYS